MADMLSLFGDAERHFIESLNLAEQLGDVVLTASVYHNFGMLRNNQGRFDEALEFFERALPNRPDNTRRFPWEGAADTHLRLGHNEAAKALYEQALSLNRRLRDDEGIAHVLRGLTTIACRAHDAALAESLLRENEEICRKMANTRGLSLTAQLYGDIARLRGERHTAREYYRDALLQLEKMGDVLGSFDVMASLGHLAVFEGNCAEALRYFQQAQDGWKALDAKLTPFEARQIQDSLDKCEG